MSGHRFIMFYNPNFRAVSFIPKHMYERAHSDNHIIGWPPKNIIGHDLLKVMWAINGDYRTRHEIASHIYPCLSNLEGFKFHKDFNLAQISTE